MMESFPKLPKQIRRGNAGVEIVSSVVNNELHWLFRKVHKEDDYGVDGYIDIVLDDGSVTGQSLAVQVKTGESYFKTTTKAGYVFYGEGKHLNYYLNSQVPTLIVLCDAGLRRCYWELFDARKTERTERGWKMVIPFAQVLEAEAKPELLEIIGPAVDHAAALDEHWAFNELLVDMGDHVHFAIDREEIETGNMEHILSFFGRLVSNLSVCERLQGRVDISVVGYEEDPRELWQIPEVRNWFGMVEPKVQYWFYFLDSRPPAAGLRLLVLCLCEVETKDIPNAARQREMDLDKEKLGCFLERNLLSFYTLANHVRMSVERSLEIHRSVLKILLPEYEPEW